MDRVMGFLVCAGVIVGAQYVAVVAHAAWWESETGSSATVPESTVQFITFVVSLGVSWVILKVWPDDDQ